MAEARRVVDGRPVVRRSRGTPGAQSLAARAGSAAGVSCVQAVDALATPCNWSVSGMAGRAAAGLAGPAAAQRVSAVRRVLRSCVEPGTAGISGRRHSADSLHAGIGEPRGGGVLQRRG